MSTGGEVNKSSECNVCHSGRASECKLGILNAGEPRRLRASREDTPQREQKRAAATTVYARI